MKKKGWLKEQTMEIHSQRRAEIWLRKWKCVWLDFSMFSPFWMTMSVLRSMCLSRHYLFGVGEQITVPLIYRASAQDMIGAHPRRLIHSWTWFGWWDPRHRVWAWCHKRMTLGSHGGEVSIFGVRERCIVVARGQTVVDYIFQKRP